MRKSNSNFNLLNNRDCSGVEFSYKREGNAFSQNQFRFDVMECSSFPFRNQTSKFYFSELNCNNTVTLLCHFSFWR